MSGPVNPTDARLGQVATLERLSRIRPREATFPFVDNDEVVLRQQDARRILAAAEERRRKRVDRLLPLVKDDGGDVVANATAIIDAPDPEVDAARANLAEADAAVTEATSHVVFRAIPPSEYETLLGEHPPTPEQKEQMGAGLDHNPQTFIPALISACAYDPKLTAEQIDELLAANALSGADVQGMFNLCFLLCTTRRTAALGKG